MTKSTRSKQSHLRVAQTANLLGVSPDTVRALFDRGDLTGSRTASGHRQIDVGSVEKHRPFHTVSGAARLLNCSAETVRSRFDSGELWGYRTQAGSRRIDPASIPATDPP